MINILATIIMLVLPIGFFLGSAILEGWCLSILWGWYMVPIFKLPELGVRACIGLACISMLLAKQYVPGKDKQGEIDWTALAYPLVSPMIALFIGWMAL